MTLTLDLGIVIASFFALIAYWFKNYQKTKIVLKELINVGDKIPFYDKQEKPITNSKYYILINFIFLNASESSTSIIDFDLSLFDKNNKKLNYRIPVTPGKICIHNDSNSDYIFDMIAPFDIESFLVPPRERLSKSLLIGYDIDLNEISMLSIKMIIAEKPFFYPFRKTRTIKFKRSLEDLIDYEDSKYFIERPKKQKNK